MWISNRFPGPLLFYSPVGKSTVFPFVYQFGNMKATEKTVLGEKTKKIRDSELKVCFRYPNVPRNSGQIVSFVFVRVY